MNPTSTLFERWISRPRRALILVAIAFGLLASVPLAAAADGVLGEFFQEGTWRLLVYPTIIAYILFVALKLGEMDRAVARAFRQLLQGGEEAAVRLLQTVPLPRPLHEVLVFALGVVFGLAFMGFAGNATLQSWLGIVWCVTASLMYGLLFWAVYLSIVSTRQVAALHRQPLLIDPFDISPFEPIGRQALLLALTFVGGITIGALFAGFQVESLKMLEFWLAYIPPAVVPIAVFFANMLPTHRVISAAKARELELVRRQFAQSSRALSRGIEDGLETQRLAQQVLALAAYEQELERTRTWPYNTGMLRTLFFSVLVPAATFIARILGEDLP